MSRAVSPRARSFSESLSGTFTFCTAGAGEGARIGIVGPGSPSAIALRSLAISLKRSPRGRPPQFVPGFMRSHSDTRLPPLPHPEAWQCHCLDG